MIISHNFGISLEEYETRGLNNDFPLFHQCPNCKCPSSGNLHRNGYYWRYVDVKSIWFLRTFGEVFS